MSVIRVSEPANRNAARGLGTTFARWPTFQGHCTAKHSKDRDPAPGSFPDGEQRSARASVRTPTLRRAAQREGVGMNTCATASSAARGRRVEIQRYRERRSENAPAHRLLGAGVGGPPVGGVGGPGRGGGRGREAPRGRPSKLQSNGEQRSARASARTPALRRAAQRERAFPAAAGWWGRGAASWRGGGAWRGGVRGGRPTTFARWPRY